MTCADLGDRLSAWRDGGLAADDASALRAHLGACAACAAEERSWRATFDTLAGLPRLDAGGEIAARVLDRLEVESRGPGLALLFRPASAARPLFLPSLVPAALVLVTIVSATLTLDQHWRQPPAVVVDARGRELPDPPANLPPSGTEGNPMLQTSEVSAPRGADPMPRQALEQMGEGTLFIETVVARDGSVSAVTLLAGDAERPEPLLDALRRERWQPARLNGRKVAVSIYRLISRVEVLAPIT